jgi:hypothetical protein
VALEQKKRSDNRHLRKVQAAAKKQRAKEKARRCADILSKMKLEVAGSRRCDGDGYILCLLRMYVMVADAYTLLHDSAARHARCRLSVRLGRGAAEVLEASEGKEVVTFLSLCVFCSILSDWSRRPLCLQGSTVMNDLPDEFLAVLEEVWPCAGTPHKGDVVAEKFVGGLLAG